VGRGNRQQTAGTDERAIRDRIEELEDSVLHHKNLYYTKSEPEISDAEFDALEEELRRLREAHPDVAETVVADEESALQRVGAGTDNTFQEVRHETPMLSLDKVHTEEDLRDWIEKHPGERFALWPKFDGVSLSLTYKNGELVRAASRGDGRIGEDITANAIRVDGVQRRLPEKIDCEIRGEVIMLRSEFNRYNQANPDRTLSNPRNAVSGTLRLKDPADARGRKLVFYPFDLIIDEPTQQPLRERLASLGFGAEGYGEAERADDVLAFIEDLESRRDSLDYEIDGIVIKIADPDKYHALGTTAHHPRGAVAMKMAAEIGETEIEEVEWAVGKTGKVVPRARIQTLFLAGTNIQYATLHNWEDIQRKGIRIGQRVQIKRAGDVIPFIIGPTEGSEGQGKEIPIPTKCPSCGTDLEEIGDSKILQCPNSKSCPAQASRRMQHWVSRAGADIEGLSARTLERLEDAGLVRSPSDIYKLSADDLASLEGLGTKSAENIISSIEEKKDLGLRRALIAWSIPNASEGTAKRLCLAGYKTPEEIRDASPQELARVEDIGPVVAESIHDFFQSPETAREIERLRAAGVNLDVHAEDEPQKIKTQTPLTGKTVCLTGTLSVSRSAFKKELEAVGAKPTGSVSGRTDFLLAGADAGSKLKKAEDLGVTIISEAEARAMLS
jgi:DNA ligase (NAD+)